MQRPSKHEYYLGIAKEVAKRSQDKDTQVGMILVNPDTGGILSTGYNGFIKGADDPNLPLTRPQKYEFFVHAEPNLIYNCARHGIATEGCIVYGTTTPCGPCIRALWQCGICEMYVSSIHPTFENTKKLADMNVAVQTMHPKDGQDFWWVVFSPRQVALPVEGAKDPYSGKPLGPETEKIKELKGA
jgi:dCMP deaminase